MQDKPDLCCFGLIATYPDPEYFVHQGISTRMRSEYFPDYLERLGTAGRILDLLERMACFQALDAALVEQAVIIPLAYPHFYVLVKPWVKRFPLVWAVEGSWQDIIIEPHD